MDCETFHRDLPDLIYGELDPEARPLVDDHRRGCVACDALTRELEQVKGALPQLRVARVERGLGEAPLEFVDDLGRPVHPMPTEADTGS